MLNTKTHDRYGIQFARRKDFSFDKMWEVFQACRNGSDKYMIEEGTPDDFFEREILHLTASVIQQNIETSLPHLLLFHDGANEAQMTILEELRTGFEFNITVVYSSLILIKFFFCSLARHKSIRI